MKHLLSFVALLALVAIPFASQAQDASIETTALPVPELVSADPPLPPGPSGAGAPAADLPGTVNCFDYYTFGSVQVDLSASVGSTVSGVPLTFTGTVTNDNDYPVVDGAVYVKIFRQSDNASVNAQGYAVVDQFFVEEGMSLAANESRPASFQWDVPASLPSGDYQAAFFYTSAHKFNLLGLSFTDDVVGNVTDFRVTGEIEDIVSLVKDTVTIAGADYHFAAFTPKVDQRTPVEISIEVANDTDTEQTVPVTWKTYAWDHQSEENMIEKDTTSVTVPAQSSVRTSAFVTDVSSSVYLVIAEAEYADTSSILNIRFARENVPTTRINFPAVTTYPLVSGEQATVFSCLHGAGTLDVVPNGKLVLALTDDRDQSIHTYTYEGGVSGAMMGVKDDFTPRQTYETFTLTASLYNDGVLVDEAVMQYDCAALGEECGGAIVPTTVAGQNESSSFAGTLVLLISLIALVGAAVLFVVRRNKDGSAADTASEKNNNSDMDHSDTTGGHATLFMLFVFALVSMFAACGSAQVVDAKSVSWNTTSVPELYYLWKYSLPYPDYATLTKNDYGYSKALDANSNVTVTYNTHLEDADTGAALVDGDTIPVGTRVKAVWDRQDTDISWFGTGYSLDSPFGTWQAGAADVADYCTDYFVNTHTFDVTRIFDVYVPLSVNPPTKTLSGAGVTCVGDVCDVTGAGAITIDVTFPATYGKFYYRYWGDGAGTTDGCYVLPDEPLMACTGGTTKVTVAGTVLYYCGYVDPTGASTPINTINYQLDVPEHTISYTLNTVVGSTTAPNPPAITDDAANTHTVGDAQAFDFVATDADGDTIKYEIDWIMDGMVDVSVPSLTYVASGVSQSASRTWATAGVKTFQVRTKDDTGAMSAWVGHTITTCDVTETWDGSSCQPLPIDASCGAADGVPTVEAPDPALWCATGDNGSIYENAVRYSWSCKGINGGANKGCDASKTVVAGVCGPGNGVPTGVSPAKGDMCSMGLIATVEVNAAGFTWNCNGQNGGPPASPSCEAPEIAPGPVGMIYAADCIIAAGDSTCFTSAEWSSMDTVTPIAVDNDGAVFSNAPSSTGTLEPVGEGNHVFSINDNGVLLDTVVVQGTCAYGSAWNGLACVAGATPPIVTLTAAPVTITSGDSSTLTWTVAGTADACWAWGDASWTGLKLVTGGTEAVSPLITTTYTLQCWNVGATDGPHDATVTVGTPTASTTASNCTISLNNDSCDSTVMWDSSGLGTPNMQQDGVTFSADAANPGTPRTIVYGTHTFSISDGAGPALDSATAVASCESGTTWELTKCVTEVITPQ